MPGTTPELAAALADQTSAEDAAWSFTVPAGTFVDVDGDTLSYAATLAGGDPLPGWLSFDTTTQTFSGTPPANFNLPVPFETDTVPVRPIVPLRVSVPVLWLMKSLVR